MWVCLADDPPPFEATVADAVVERLGDLESIEHYGMDNLQVGRRIVYDVKANWKLIIENFMECYHCATIHPELTEVLPEFADGYAAQYFVGTAPSSAPTSRASPSTAPRGWTGIPGVSEEQDRRYYAITIKPQVFINLVPDHVIFHRMYPLAPDRTVVECDWLYLPGVVESGKDVSASVELFHRVNQQDFDACERCQPAMSSRVYAQGRRPGAQRAPHRGVPPVGATPRWAATPDRSRPVTRGGAGQARWGRSGEVAHPVPEPRPAGP